MNENIRKYRVAIVIALIIAAVLVGFLAYRGKFGGLSGPILAPPTKEPVPPGTTVPGPTSPASANVALPHIVVPAAPRTSASFRNFDVQIRADAFIPDTVIVREGDTAHVSFTAADKNYDVVQPDYRFRLQIPQGATKLLEFAGINVGKYTIYCESCGWPKKGPVGYLVIVPK